MWGGVEFVYNIKEKAKSVLLSLLPKLFFLLSLNFMANAAYEKSYTYFFFQKKKKLNSNLGRAQHTFKFFRIGHKIKIMFHVFPVSHRLKIGAHFEIS